MSVDGRLGQAGGNDRFTERYRLLLTFRSDHFYLEETGSAFSVACNFLCQLRIDVIQRLFKNGVVLILPVDHRISRHAVGQQQHRIVGRGISVHRHHVVSILYIIAQCLLQHFLCNGCIGCHKSKHGAHIGMDHAGSFAHASHSHRSSADFHLSRRIFGFRIRGHNGFCRFQPGLLRIRLSFRQKRNPVPNPVHWKLHSDDSCRRHQYGRRRDTKQPLCSLCRLLTVAIAFLSRARIGNPGIDNDRMHICRFFHNLLIPSDRRRFHHVGRKCPRCHAWNLTVDQRHVFPVFIFDLRLCCCRFKSFCSRYAACNDLHLPSSC